MSATKSVDDHLQLLTDATTTDERRAALALLGTVADDRPLSPIESARMLRQVLAVAVDRARIPEEKNDALRVAQKVYERSPCEGVSLSPLIAVLDDLPFVTLEYALLVIGASRQLSLAPVLERFTHYDDAFVAWSAKEALEALRAAT